MNILIKNCNLISMDNGREKCEENIDIYIEEGKILEIGKNLNQNAQKVINAKNKYVMPGLINTHSHIPMSIFRETTEGYDLQEWLKEKIWPIEDKLTPKDIYYGTMLSCIEMIKTGTTTINDMYGFTEEIIKAALETGIRLQTTKALMSLIGDGEKRLLELEEIINKYNGKYENITLNVGIHGLYTSDEEYIKKCIELAKKYSLPIHIHFAENNKEVEDIELSYGVKPVKIIEKYFNNIHTILAHGVKLESEDIKVLNKNNIYISHCPISNLRLGCGIAKVQEMRDNGITVSIGTDGQGSGSNLDMFEVMKFTGLLQKGINENPKNLPAYEVLKMATVNGAKTLGLEEKVGSIEVGKQADIIILDMNTEVMQPMNDIFANIVYNAKGSNVNTTIVNGRILMEDRQLSDIDEEEIYEKCQHIIYKA